MKATDLLKKQHQVVDDLFKRFEKAESGERAAIFDEIAANLVAHDAIEREIFYPAAERALGHEGILAEAIVEHGVVEFSLFRADRARRRGDFEQYVTVLREIVKHHVKEEENELLPKVKRAMENDELEALGEQMSERFEQALAKDFRRPLRANLQQVLGGNAGSASRGRASKRRSGTTRKQTRSAA
jgi:hemerythrin-like domain-containing protein